MLPQRLKELRTEAGLTQKEIADKLKIGQNSYSNWEKGIRTPIFPTLEKLAELFNVSTDYLLGKSGVKNPRQKSELELLIDQLDKEQKEDVVSYIQNLISSKL